MKRIILCADGTGNKGGTTPDTNVFRIYNDVAKTDQNGTKQITYYDKGVGTSSHKVMSGISGAFGFGLRKNVTELYEFLARHYEKGDEIFLFGFSRGAATVRAFAGMIQTCGLISLYTADKDTPDKRIRKPEKRFQAEIKEAMQFYEKQGIQSRTSLNVAPPESLTDSWGNTYLPSAKVSIKFIGVWDTVSALGFPKDWSWIVNRAFRFLDKMSDILFWPHRFYNYQLSEQVENVYHALALDDERRTFHPRVWREKKKPGATEGFLRPKNIEQVWFTGAHSNVGGGYPRDGLSLLTLDWMLQRAVHHDLALKTGVQALVAQDANAHGKFYDSRSGMGVYYRYEPRNLEKLCVDNGKMEQGSIKIHESVFERMAQLTENYAPGQFPFRFQIVKTQIGAGAKNCQAAKDKKTWNAIRQSIGNFVESRRRLYTIFVESTLLVLLFGWFFWVIPPLLQFSKGGDWHRHVVDVLTYFVPEYLDGLIIYTFANNPLIGWLFIIFTVLFCTVRKCLKEKMDYLCRKARDHLIEQNMDGGNEDDQNYRKVPTLRRRLIQVEAFGPTLFLFLVSLVLIPINLSATFQGKPSRICGDFSGEVVTHANKCENKVTVDANQYWNNSGVLLEKGVTYRVDMPDGQTWMDASKEATPTGWKSPEEGIFKFLGETFARETSKGLFHLMGSINGKCEGGHLCAGEQFPIGTGTTFTADVTGEFCAFANDLPFMYWNNTKEIIISISRVSDEPCELSTKKE